MKQAVTKGWKMQISFQSSNEADEEQGKRHAKQESKHSKQKIKQLGQLSAWQKYPVDLDIESINV